MQFTSEQVLALAPDAAVANDGRQKLANLQHWRSSGSAGWRHLPSHGERLVAMVAEALANG